MTACSELNARERTLLVNVISKHSRCLRDETNLDPGDASRRATFFAAPNESAGANHISKVETRGTAPWRWYRTA